MVVEVGGMRCYPAQASSDRFEPHSATYQHTHPSQSGASLTGWALEPEYRSLVETQFACPAPIPIEQ